MGFAQICALVSAFVVWSLALAGDMTATGRAQADDGDDLIINDNDYRLSGIDTFEKRQLCKAANNSSVPCGAMAKDALAKLVDGQSVTCHDTGKRDGRRIIALCLIGRLDIQEEMVRIGWAFVRPDFAGTRTSRLCMLEAEAARARLGAWALDFERPYFAKRGRNKTFQQISCRHAWAR